MPHRTLLSPEQRTRVLGIPTEAAEMAKHYVLSTEDLALVRTKRRLSNRLGFAVQLCALRHPGRPFERSEVPPAAMLAFVANQVGADPKLFGDYAHRAETRREHLLELQQYLRLRSFRLADWRACLNVGANAAWATDRGVISEIYRCAPDLAKLASDQSDPRACARAAVLDDTIRTLMTVFSQHDR
jgi:TnpA family transposase